MFIYCDESGNTGWKYDDQDQPNYFLLALCSEKDLSILLKNEFSDILSKTQLKNIHAKKIRTDRTNQYLFNEISKLIQKFDLHFILINFDKIHGILLKFFDTFFDNGLNEVVDPIEYASHKLDLVYLTILHDVFDIELRKEFWNAYITCDKNNVICTINKLKNKLEESIFAQDYPSDVSRILNILDYAKENIQKFILDEFNGETKLLEAPNTPAFRCLIDLLNKKNIKEKIHIVHDDQIEFQPTLEHIFKYYKDTNYNISERRTDFVDSYLDSFTFENDKSQIGLQIVDFLVYNINKYYNEKSNLNFEKIEPYFYHHIFTIDSIYSLLEKNTEQKD